MYTLPCACANLRRADRAVSQFYDAALRPSGLRITQFTLLQALTLAPKISQRQLSELLDIDSTTLTRTLAPLRRKGWLRSATGTDRRELRLSLTAAGKAAIPARASLLANGSKGPAAGIRPQRLESFDRDRRAYRGSHDELP
jgi:DNA-binding MarR family transcriptional regulator